MGILSHHTFKKSTENKNDIDLNEIGPRFDMKCKRVLKILFNKVHFFIDLIFKCMK